MTDHLQELSEAGVSIWLDDLSRERLETDNLKKLIADSHVVGVTTNPTIFATAIADGERYDAQVGECADSHAEVTDSLIDDTIFALTTTDVANACDLFTEVFGSTHGVDGRVSIEVSPTLADDTGGTVNSAKELSKAVDRPNVLIKIPATRAGMPAITETIGEGISVNVTLIFGLDQYQQVMQAYVAGLEQARERGHDLSTIHSVASFFVSRVDTEIDKRLEKLHGTVSGKDLMGKAAVANARLAYEAYEEFFVGDRWEQLEALGANKQRPLWASTGVKNPDYSDTMYVDELVVENTVNTMPEKTLDAVRDHGEIAGDQVRHHYRDAHDVMRRLEEAGISYDDVINTLIEEGVDKFAKSWEQLRDTVRGQLERALEK